MGVAISVALSCTYNEQNHQPGILELAPSISVQEVSYIVTATLTGVVMVLGVTFAPLLSAIVTDAIADVAQHRGNLSAIVPAEIRGNSQDLGQPNNMNTL